LVTFTLILLESTVLAMDRYKEPYAISQDRKASRLSESVSLSDLSHSMPHDCVIDFWESRLLDSVERERITARNRNLHETAASDVFPCGLFTIAARDIARNADYGARRISNDHSIEAHETP
jgi:hypothetical protein